MKITYVTHTRFPVQKAHGKQIAEVCAALAALGHTVTLLRPSVRNIITTDPFTFYGVPKSFTVRVLSHFDATRRRLVPGFLHLRVNMFFFRRALRHFLATHRTDILYVRSTLLLKPLLATHIPVILELHELPRRGKRRFARLCNRCKRVVCLTRLMRDELAKFGVEKKRMVVEPDGVDLARFRKLGKVKRTAFPEGRPLIGYVGSFTTRRRIEKGISVLLQALAILKRANVPVHALFVGGWGNEVDPYKREARQLRIDRDVLFLGFLPPALVPARLQECDLLVYPAPASLHPYFLRDTSPLKLFEYLAAGKPVVCADLPPLREVVNKDSVFFFTPGDPESLAHWLAYVITHSKEAKKRAEQGKKLVLRYDWESRMDRILKFS